MDDTLRKAIAKKLELTDFEQQFVKSFRKVFGLTPEIESVSDNNVVRAHGEDWALDGHGWLLWRKSPKFEWMLATAEMFKDEVGKTDGDD